MPLPAPPKIRPRRAAVRRGQSAPTGAEHGPESDPLRLAPDDALFEAAAIDADEQDTVLHEAVSLSEEDGVLNLHLGDSPWIQGAMRLDAPDALELEYVRQMTAWLAFLHAPARIAQLGLGAGSLARWNLKHLRATRTTVVERNPAVVLAARTMFRLPADGARLEVVVDDAGQWAANGPRGAFGAVQVDLYDGEARGPVIDDAGFYGDCRNLLDPAGGIAVVNLFGHGRGLARSMRHLREAFDGRVLLLAPCRAGNRIALGFSGPVLDVPAAMLEARVGLLERRFGWPLRDWLDGGDMPRGVGWKGGRFRI